MLKGLSLVKRRANKHAATGPQESKSFLVAEKDTAESGFLLLECPHVHVPLWKREGEVLSLRDLVQADGL